MTESRIIQAVRDAEWLLENGADSRQVLAVLYGAVPKRPVTLIPMAREVNPR